MTSLRPSRRMMFALLFTGGILVPALLQVAVQRRFEERYPSKSMENLLYLPAGKHLKVMSAGFPNVLADALWAKAIGYFGGHVLTDKEYPWLYHILDQVTSLDPLFRYPYIFGGIVLSVEGSDPEKSIALMRKGMEYHPDDWRLPFYIGYNYFYYLKDPARAAEYLLAASSLPAHPQYLPRLAASLMSKAGRLDAAIAFLETVAASTEEEFVRQGLRRKIEDLKAGRYPASLEDFLGGDGGD